MSASRLALVSTRAQNDQITGTSSVETTKNRAIRQRPSFQ